jgi:hypothetical protein
MFQTATLILVPSMLIEEMKDSERLGEHKNSLRHIFGGCTLIQRDTELGNTHSQFELVIEHVAFRKA